MQFTTLFYVISLRFKKFYINSSSGELKSITVNTKDKSGNLLDTVTYRYYLSSEKLNCKLTNDTVIVFSVTGLLRSVTLRNGTEYSYIYNFFGDVVSVSINGENQVQYNYRVNDNKLVEKRLANQYSEKYVYDNNNGRLTEVWTRNSDNATYVKTYTYNYSVDGSIIRIEDHNNDYIYDYQYDINGRLIIESRGKISTKYYDQQIEYVYDNNGNLIQINNIGESQQSFDYENNTSMPRISGETLINNHYVKYEYDKLGRQTTTSIYQKKGDTATKLKETYSYLTIGENTTYTITSKAIAYGTSAGITYSYTYCMDNPALGSDKLSRPNPYNIWQIKENGVVKVTYNYDLLGRLVREDNAYVNKSITYTYDTNNNITSKTEYAYTTGTLSASGTKKTYTYGNSTYKDRLTSYNGQSIVYDALGNPTTYLGKTLTWNGRQLISYTNGSTNIAFAYDFNGIRLSKTVDGVKTEYFYNGTQLLREKKGNTTIRYIYDDIGIVGIQYNGVNYYYVRNLLGDVTKIIDINGNVVVEYSYDSWGKVLSTTGSKASTVGLDNPIRYRGYYYDTETSLYYLNSRYYDAETGRFISADSVAENGNLYTYCQNDPVNRSDESGYLSKFWTRIIKIAIGVVTAVAAVAITVASGGAALPVVASIAASAGISAGLGAIGAAINGGDVFEAATDGLVDGFMWGGMLSMGGAGIKAGSQGNLLNGAKPSYNSSSTVKPDLGNKLDYAFGEAKGNLHNVQRSTANLNQLRHIGIHNNSTGRQILADHFANVFYANESLIMNNVGRTTINSLLAGPGGFLGVLSIWENNKLITFIFFGG